VSWVTRHVQDAWELGRLPSPGDAMKAWRIDVLTRLSTRRLRSPRLFEV